MNSLGPELARAVEAAQDKKAAAICVLELASVGGFTDYFLVCTGFSSPQVQAISDAVEERLAGAGLRPRHREGYENAEWVLLDYGFLVVHIFSERARLYYDLERLWRTAPRFDVAEPAPARLPI